MSSTTDNDNGSLKKCVVKHKVWPYFDKVTIKKSTTFFENATEKKTRLKVTNEHSMHVDQGTIDLAELRLKSAINANKDANCNEEMLELQSRLSAFDRFMFLIDDEYEDDCLAAAFSYKENDDDDEGETDDDSNDDSDDDDYYDSPGPPKEFFGQYLTSLEEENDDLKTRLSVFESFFFLIDE